MAFPVPLTAPYAGSAPLRPERTIAVITTFNRSGLLAGLLESITQDSHPVAAVVVIDNASTDGTAELLRARGDRLPSIAGGEIPLRVERMAENTGGAGGFRRGMEIALSEEFEELVPRDERWLWLMDDDVAVLPGALQSLAEARIEADLIHGTRLNPDGSEFFWRHRFDPATGIHWPLDAAERTAPLAETNVACFEGALVSSLTADRVGLPDARFFITSDDTTYGYLASRQVRVVVSSEPVLRKTRSQSSIDLGVRHLNDASDLSRYYAMRNRGLMAQHLAETGGLKPLGFGLGTALTAAKEAVRLLLVEVPGHLKAEPPAAVLRHTAASAAALWKGTRDGLKLMKGASR